MIIGDSSSLPPLPKLTILEATNRLNSIYSRHLVRAEANAAKALAEQEALAEEQTMQEWKGGGRAGSQIITRSPKSGNQKMANIGKVKFQPPNVPVIFVLG